MSASSQSHPDSPDDVEITAKLPVLDVAAYEARHGHDALSGTDTWVAPTLDTAVLPQLPTLLMPPGDPPPGPVEAATVSARLEAELKSLTSSLAELETRLAAKGERLTQIEVELTQAHAAGRAAAEHAATLEAELTGQRAAVAAAATQIEGLRETIRERDEALRAAGDRQGELQASRQQVARLQAQSAAHLEVLHSMEGRRGIFDSMLRALDLAIADHDQDQARLSDDLARNTTHGMELARDLERQTRRVADLEAETAALNSRLAARTEEAAASARTNEELKQSLQALNQESEARAQALQAAIAAHGALEAANAALSAQKSALQSELEQMQEESAGQRSAVQQIAAEHAGRLAQIEAGQAELAALREQLAAQARNLESEVERHRAAQERIAVVEGDLRVAEESINRLESDLRSRSMRVEELTRINTQIQADIADARRWLNERDSLMQRLESEAAHSTALVDNIQRSVRSLAPGNSGSHEALREIGARLLVRSKDGHEVVHVLGRKTTIGRTPDNDLQIDASFISRHHAVLLFHGQQTLIEDLNSTNGVYVNGQRISRETLNDGDTVMVGKARFRFMVRPPVSRGQDSA
ncbi:MAG TPA: FHA domain-containing protein [Steroidobacteraceae bacterium]|nr:FHA domain-containing protein [Steroidobacteraceae bacterium]